MAKFAYFLKERLFPFEENLTKNLEKYSSNIEFFVKVYFFVYTIFKPHFASIHLLINSNSFNYILIFRPYQLSQYTKSSVYATFEIRIYHISTHSDNSSLNYFQQLKRVHLKKIKNRRPEMYSLGFVGIIVE